MITPMTTAMTMTVRHPTRAGCAFAFVGAVVAPGEGAAAGAVPARSRAFCAANSWSGQCAWVTQLNQLCEFVGDGVGHAREPPSYAPPLSLRSISRP